MYTCLYCNNQYTKNTEHVFPHGLGGENILIDCVCKDCNNEFSRLERELYQKSPVALIRSVKGVVGNKSRNNKSALKAPLLISHDKVNNIVYEVGQSEKMTVYLRPQILQIKHVFYCETDLQNNLDIFIGKFKDWKYNNLRIVLKFPKSKSNTIRFAQIEKYQNNYFHKIVTDNLKVKNEIVLNLFSKSDVLYKHLDARIYMDDDRHLKLRARTEHQAIKFILSLLKFSDSGQLINSCPSENKNPPEVSVGLNFDSRKCEQALVKIGLNILFHYFPNTKGKSEIQQYIDFVKTGSRNFSSELQKKNNIIDSVDDAHNIFIHQTKTFLSIRISLFNGQFAYSFLIPGLQIMTAMNYSRLVIDYKSYKNRFENQASFLNSFHHGIQY